MLMTRLALAPLLVGAATLAAQTEEAAAERTPSQIHAALDKACAKMANLQGVRFTSSESQDNSFTRQMGGMLGGGGSEVVGRWSPDTVELEIGDDDEVVVHRGRMIARNDDSEWALRRDCLVNGRDLPFVFDPSRFFECLNATPKEDLDVTRDEVTSIREKEYLVVSITLEDEAADNFVFAGCLPKVSDGGFKMPMMLGGLGGARMPKPTLTVDLAIYIDQESHLVDRIRAKAYRESPFGGNVVVQFGAGGGDEEEEEEEVQTRDAAGNQIYKKGLPVRKVDDKTSAMSLTIRFKDHGKPFLAELDEPARKLLRMR